MNYFDTIKSVLNDHILYLESLSTDNDTKAKNHLEKSSKIDAFLSHETPEKMRDFIDYLSNEARGFGWSYPNNETEDLCEISFWNMHSIVKKLICGMSGNERLYYFGYLEEFEKIPIKHKSDRDRILSKLFMI